MSNMKGNIKSFINDRSLFHFIAIFKGVCINSLSFLLTRAMSLSSLRICFTTRLSRDIQSSKNYCAFHSLKLKKNLLLAL